MRESISGGAAAEGLTAIRHVRCFDGGNARMITCDSLVYQPFRPAGGALACDGVSIQSIVERAGTPTYIYSARAIRESYRDIDEAFASYPHAIHYALKANSTLAIARLLRSLGSRADANSGGEIAVAERAGFAPDQIVFTGVGKTREELEYAIAQGVGTINAESAGELDRIASIAQAHGRVARVARRDVAGLRFTGVHIHIGSQITTLEPLTRAADALVTLAVQLRDDGFALEH